MRQIVLDTETTGLEAAAGHRVIEVGCVELVKRRYTTQTFHRYINPEREVDAGALEVHGLDNEFLRSKPTFAQIAREFVDFVSGAELVIHNADFDIGFINHELRRVPSVPDDIREVCKVLDTLKLARRLHPGQRNSLDALSKRYEIDNSHRELHGALLDAELLAGVYLAMTGGQVSLSLDDGREDRTSTTVQSGPVDLGGVELVVIEADDDEQAAHARMLDVIRKASGGNVLWDVTSVDPPAVSPENSKL